MRGADLTREWATPASFGIEFVRSEAFSVLFEEGMDLIEEVAAYLEGAGHEQSSTLRDEQALAYTHESVLLTGRLMQIASWLLAQRALVDGEVTHQEGVAERGRLRPMTPSITPEAVFETLPKDFRELAGLTVRLYTRIQHLEDLLREAEGEQAESGNPVAEQHWLLERAFASRN